MSDKRRGLGRGLGALIPPQQSVSARPSDVFFPTSGRGTSDGFTGNISERPNADADAATASPASASDAKTEPTSTAEVSGATANESTAAADAEQSTESDLQAVPGAAFAEIEIDQVRPNPRQPRTVFDEDELAELVHSIREIGVLQPIVVRPLGPQAVADDGVAYELIMGERRLRASKAAGRTTIPAIVRSTSDDDMLRDALLENLHRAQLNPLEEAAAYQQLLDDFSCTHDELAGRIGRSRPQITNTMRLLKLPALVQRRVAAGVLSAGHARALLGLPDAAAMERLAQRIVAEGLSVRSTEEVVALGGDKERATRRSGGTRVSPQLEGLANSLSDQLDTRVKIAMGKSRGRLTVEFAGEEDLDRILAQLGVQR